MDREETGIVATVDEDRGVTLDVRFLGFPTLLRRFFGLESSRFRKASLVFPVHVVGRVLLRGVFATIFATSGSAGISSSKSWISFQLKSGNWSFGCSAWSFSDAKLSLILGSCGVSICIEKCKSVSVMEIQLLIFSRCIN